MTADRVPIAVAAGGPGGGIDAWLDLPGRVARHYRLPLSEQRARLAAHWELGNDDEARIRTLARATGLGVQFVLRRGDAADELAAAADRPAARRRDRADRGDRRGGPGPADRAGRPGGSTHLPIDQLTAGATGYVIPRPSRSAPDTRIDAYIRPFQDHWLRDILMADAPSYGHVAVASVVTNCLGLAGVLFSMQVYDRVVLAGSIPTLTILFIGVLIAIGFDFVLRRLRTNIVDVAWQAGRSAHLGPGFRSRAAGSQPRAPDLDRDVHLAAARTSTRCATC
ncbi:hypothetical protein QP185_19020 [Sphingomonas aerolata]|uniref:hypothetical protein n=1 Tax=Sphingomonas aerolata TaxID=185951 RepID=UPI002FE399FF